MKSFVAVVFAAIGAILVAWCCGFWICERFWHPPFCVYVPTLDAPCSFSDVSYSLLRLNMTQADVNNTMGMAGMLQSETMNDAGHGTQTLSFRCASRPVVNVMLADGLLRTKEID